MQAFRLTKQSEAEGFSGGSVNCSSAGHAFDVGGALKEGNGIIVTDDDIFAEVLRSYPALESVPEEEVPQDAQPVKLPKLEVSVTPGGVGFTPQFPPEDIGGQATTGPAAEITAQHSDQQPRTTEEAIALGEAVRGATPQQGESNASNAGEDEGSASDVGDNPKSKSK